MKLRELVTIFSDNLEEGTDLTTLASLFKHDIKVFEQVGTAFVGIDSSFNVTEAKYPTGRAVCRRVTPTGDIYYIGFIDNIIVEFNVSARILVVAVIENEKDSGTKITFILDDTCLGDYDEWFVANFSAEGTANKNYINEPEKMTKYAERCTSLSIIYSLITDKAVDGEGEDMFADFNKSEAAYFEEYRKKQERIKAIEESTNNDFDWF